MRDIFSEIEKAIVTIPGERFNRRYGLFGRRTNTRKLVAGYTASVWGYRCANILGNAAAGMPWGMFAGDERLAHDHPAVDLFKYVNKRRNFEGTMRNTVVDLNIHGYAVWLPEIIGERMISFRRLPAAEIRLEDPRTEGEEVTHLVWTRGGRQTVYLREQVILFTLYGSRELDPDSPMRVVIDKLYSEQKIDETAVAHFDSMGIPPYVMTSEQRVDEKDLIRYDEWWQKLFTGVANRFKVAWAGSGLKPTRMRAPLKEMELEKLRNSIAKETCAGFGVPQGVAGARETQHKATWIMEMIAMHHLKVVPDLELMAGVINAEMMPFVYKSPEFRFLPGEVELLQEEKTARSQRVLNEWTSGFISHEKALGELSYEQGDAGPGLVAYTQHQQAQLTPGQDIMKGMGLYNVLRLGAGVGVGNAMGKLMGEARQVESKARRLLAEYGNLDGFYFEPNYMSDEDVFRIVEGVVNAES